MEVWGPQGTYKIIDTVVAKYQKYEIKFMNFAHLSVPGRTPLSGYLSPTGNLSPAG